MRRSALVVAFGLVLSACSGSADDKREIWSVDSVGIDFVLTNWGRRLCEFSATREQLTGAQLDGLSSLRLRDGIGAAAACDGFYSITIHGRDGSSVAYEAISVYCSGSLFLPIEDFDAWAKSTPCSLQP